MSLSHECIIIQQQILATEINLHFNTNGFPDAFSMGLAFN